MPGAARTSAQPRQRRDKWIGFVSRYGLLIAFLVTIGIFSLAKPADFPTLDNLKSILTTAAPAAIVAVGLTVVLVMRDFDLSLGAMISLGSAVPVVLMAHDNVPWLVAVLAALGAGIVVGLANGVIVAYLGGSSFIITLAMGTVLTGVEYGITNQSSIYQGLAQAYDNISGSSFLGFSDEIWIALVFGLIIWALLDRTETGRYMYAVGGNPEATRLAGVRVRVLRVFGFILVAVAAAIAGILISSQSQAYSPDSGVAYLLPAFAAAFLGSAVFRPGQFNVPGTIVGVVFLQVIQTGLTMLNLQTYVINLVQGGILICAVLVSRIGQRAQ